MLARCGILLCFLCTFTPAFASQWETTEFPLERNGLRLHVQRTEYQENTNAKPLLLVHGLTYSSHEFDIEYQDYSVVRFFARMGYSVWTLDIAGYGRSEKPADGFTVTSAYAAEDIAAAAECIRQHSGHNKLHVLGWSWGTVTSATFAEKHPDYVEKLFLYAPILTGLGERAVTVPFQTTSWEHAADDFQKLPDGSIDYSIVEPAVAAVFLAHCWRYDGEGSPNGGRRDLLVASQERLINATALRMPVLLITGDQDAYVDLAVAKDTMRHLPSGSQLVILQGGGHAMMMEKPLYATFRHNVLHFLSETQ